MDAENNDAGATENLDDQQSDLASLGDLLVEDEPGSGEPNNDDAGGSQDAPPTKFNDLAGKLGLKLDDLYKLEIAQAEDGTPLTIENLKDAHGEKVDFSMREIEFEETKATQEADMIRAKEELREIMAALPAKAIAPEVLAKVRSKHEAELLVEQKRTLEIIPTWNDAEIRKTDLTGMAEHLKQYGYPVNHLERIADHRQIKYIRDNWQRELRIRKALAAVKAGKPNPTSKQKPAAKAPRKNPMAGAGKNSHNPLLDVFSNLKE